MSEARQAVRRRALAVLVGALAVACASSPSVPPPEVTAPSRLCGDPTLGDRDFCLPAEQLEALLRTGGHRVKHVEVTKSGASRPRVAYVVYAGESTGEDLVIRIKWKPAPRGGQGFNNHPRKELAAYAIQTLFLVPEAYVVPPTVGLCIPVERHRAEIGSEPPTFEGTRCVFGIAAYWLENVTPEGARDLDRFRKDPAYRLNLARLNLFTYLVDHRDGRSANFLRAQDPARPRVFAVDNGLAFGGFQNPFTPFMGDWSELQIDALPRGEIERLRGLTRPDLDFLGVVAQFESRDGVLVEVSPDAPLSDEEGVRVEPGIVQFGLTRREIDDVWERIRRLLERVDAGDLATF